MIYGFGSFEFDLAKGELRCDGEAVPIERRVFEVLHYLIEHRDRAISRQELLDACWAGVHVSDGTLSRCLTRVRAALGQPRGADRPILTLHARGYRFADPVRLIGDEDAIAEPQSEREDGPEPVQAGPERRFMTLLACRIALPKAAKRAGSEVMHASVSQFLEGLELAIKSYGGTVRGPVGDTLTLQFGYPIAAESAAQNALFMAGEISRHAASAGLEIKMGVATGPVIADHWTSSGSEEDIILGETPLDPFRIADRADAGQVLSDTATARLAAEAFVVLSRLEITFGSQAAELFELVPAQGPDVPNDLPFFGRISELLHLEQLWERARRGHGRTVIVTGEPGIGKSRLVRELNAKVIAEGARLLAAGASPLHRMTPFRPLLMVLQSRLELPPDAAPVQMLVAIEKALEESGRPESDHLPILASLVSISTHVTSRPELRLDRDRQRERTLDMLVSLLLTEPGAVPQLIWIDDVQWADPSTVAVIERVARHVTDRPELIILSARTEDAIPASVREAATTIRLTPFSRSETLRFLGQQSDAGAIRTSLIDPIAERSDGVPLFLREFLRMAEETPEADVDAVPETLQALLEARLNSAGPAKDLAHWAALIGRSFDLELLAAVSELPHATVFALVDELVGLDLLAAERGRPDRYVFHHALVQQVAFGALLDRDARIRHRRIAETLIERSPRVATDTPEEIARHFEASDRPELAAEFWKRAGHVSGNSFAVEDARKLYARALDAARSTRAGKDANRALVAEIEALLNAF